MINILKCLSTKKCLSAKKKKKKRYILHYQCLCVVSVTIDFYLLLQMHIRRLYLYMINKLGNISWARTVAGVNGGGVIDLIWIMHIYIGWICGSHLPSELRISSPSNILSSCRLDVSGGSASTCISTSSKYFMWN